MLGRTTLKRHAILVDRMAAQAGIDLQEAAMRGRITIAEIEDAVLRCTGCAQPCACESMLDRMDLPAGQVPDFCRNSEVFSELRK